MSEPDPETLAIVEEIRADYLLVAILADGSIACLQDLIHTRAILLGCDRWGWSRRFCFEDRALALARFFELQTEDDEPAGWIDRRPEPISVTEALLQELKP